MEKKLLNAISFISFICFLLELYECYYMAKTFDISIFKAIVVCSSTLLLFLLLGIFSFFKKTWLLFFTLTSGLLWSYFIDGPTWYGNWIKTALPNQLFDLLNDFPAFISGLCALLFLGIILLCILLIIKKTKENIFDRVS